ncbi:uncharacterized protein METZ01_LOCUS235912 [marine metagenome]|uniref:Uncharacterized protein n=1 Tax=marine metagenome TaxID=408172 RepID=A0A382H6X8_9ZZZZ
MVYGIGNRQGIDTRIAVYHVGGRPAAKSIRRSKPGTYTQWFGQTDLITPGGPMERSRLKWQPEQTQRHYQQQEWNKFYTAVRLGGTKQKKDRYGKLTGEWFEQAPEGITAGKWYDPKDLTMTAAIGSNRNVGRSDSAWYGGIITGVKPEVVAREKKRTAEFEKQRDLAQQELQEIEDLKQQKIDFEIQQQKMEVLASQQEARTQQLVTETARQQKINAAAEALRAKREARRAKVSPAGQQFQVTKPKKAKVTRRRYTPQRPRPYTRDPQRASTPW